jgi:flagellar biosynthesis protein FlhG
VEESLSNVIAPSRIISVGGGKGGVGKSIVALNLAATMAEMGKKVVLADMDLGAANLHLMLGIMRPKPGLQALLDKNADDPDEVLTPTSLPNLKLLAGTGAVLGAANIGRLQKRRLVRKLRSLHADVVIVDVGAGVGYNVLDFYVLGSQKILVTTPQVPAIHDAYSFLKGAVLRVLHDCADKDIDRALLAPAEQSESTEKVSALLENLRKVRPSLAEKVFGEIGRFGVAMIGNQVEQPAQAGVFRSVCKMVHDYLALDVSVLGWLPTSPRVTNSVNSCRPVVLDPTTEEAQSFRRFATTLLLDPLAEEVMDADLEIEEVQDPEESQTQPPARPGTPPPIPVNKTRPPAACAPAPSVVSVLPKTTVPWPEQEPEFPEPPALVSHLPGMTPPVSGSKVPAASLLDSLRLSHSVR